MSRIKAITAIIAGALTLAACSGGNDSAALQGTWNIETMTGIDNVKAAWKQPSISFDTAESTYSGVAGANLLNGGYKAKDGSISFGDAAMTRMMADSITANGLWPKNMSLGERSAKDSATLSFQSRKSFSTAGCTMLSRAASLSGEVNMRLARSPLSRLPSAFLREHPNSFSRETARDGSRS